MKEMTTAEKWRELGNGDRLFDGYKAPEIILGFIRTIQRDAYHAGEAFGHENAARTAACQTAMESPIGEVAQIHGNRVVLVGDCMSARAFRVGMRVGAVGRKGAARVVGVDEGVAVVTLDDATAIAALCHGDRLYDAGPSIEERLERLETAVTYAINTYFGCPGLAGRPGDMNHAMNRLRDAAKPGGRWWDDTDRRAQRLKKWLAAEMDIPERWIKPSADPSAPLDNDPAVDPGAANESLAQQVERLAAFILRDVPGEPSESEGAVDTAIRIIRRLQKQLARPKTMHIDIERGAITLDGLPVFGDIRLGHLIAGWPVVKRDNLRREVTIQEPEAYARTFGAPPTGKAAEWDRGPEAPAEKASAAEPISATGPMRVVDGCGPEQAVGTDDPGLLPIDGERKGPKRADDPGLVNGRVLREQTRRTVMRALREATEAGDTDAVEIYTEALAVVHGSTDQ